MISARWRYRKTSGIMIRPPFGSRAWAATTASSWDACCTGTAIASTARDAAAALNGFNVLLGIGRGRRIEHKSNSSDARRDLFQQPYPLAAHARFHIHETGHVATRPVDAGHEATADGIGDLHENDRDGARQSQYRLGGRCGLRKNKVALRFDQFSGE